MSNLIKSLYVNVNEQDKFIINPQRNDNEFVSFTGEKEVVKVPEEQIENEDQEFVPGVQKVLNIDRIFEEERKKNDQQAEQLLKDARQKADEIISKAQEEAARLRDEAVKEGRAEGFAKGEAEARSSYEEKEERLNQKKKEIQNELDEALDSLEPRFAEILCDLLAKLTGVVLDEHEDVLLYLIRNCIRNLDKAAHYTIRVSKADVMNVETQKSQLKQLIDDGASLDIVEELTLDANDCIVETDTQMVDCGIHTQLTNLQETLNMMTV